MRRAPITGLLTIALLLPLAACDDEATPVGDLEVSYRIGGVDTCDEVGLDNIIVSLLTTETATESAAEAPGRCDLDSPITVRDVNARSYWVRVDGYNEDGILTYSGMSDGSVTVEGGQATTTSIRMAPLPPILTIYFDFVDPGGCSVHEVQDIIVVMYDQDGNEVLSVTDNTYICDDRMDEPLIVGDDDDERLSQSITYSLYVRGTDSAGDYAFEYNEEDIEVTPGAATEIIASLASCDGICSEP